MGKHSTSLKALLSVVFMLHLLSAAAQSGRIAGTVADADGNPLPGAAVVVSGTSQGTIADNKGQFTLSAAEGQTLVVTFLGFKEKRVEVGAQTSFRIILEADENLLEDVVVVGYDTQKKVNLTGSVSSISTKELARRPITQLSTALQGIAPGVTVTTAGGAPGADSGNIQIRGIGTFGGSDCSPLVLIDGVEGNLNSVDASQIDQISVLKDAASAAIYGSRAANGVILVTTKRAEKGRFAVTYRGYVGWQTPVVYPDVVGAEEYMLLSRRASENDGAVSLYTDEYIANYRRNNYLDPDAYPIIDWQKRLMTGNGFTHNHTLNMSAGSDRIRVMTSLGYLDQNAIIKNSDFKRFNLRNNMDVRVNERLDFRLDIAATYTRRAANP